MHSTSAITLARFFLSIKFLIICLWVNLFQQQQMMVMTSNRWGKLDSLVTNRQQSTRECAFACVPSESVLWFLKVSFSTVRACTDFTWSIHRVAYFVFSSQIVFVNLTIVFDDTFELFIVLIGIAHTSLKCSSHHHRFDYFYWHLKTASKQFSNSTLLQQFLVLSYLQLWSSKLKVKQNWGSKSKSPAEPFFGATLTLSMEASQRAALIKAFIFPPKLSSVLV